MAQVTEQKTTGRGVGEVLGDVLNQAKEGIMSFGETIANKSKEAIDSTRLNTQKAQLEGENDEYLKQLGQMVREKKEYTDEMDGIIKKIEDNEQRLKTVESQISELKGDDNSQKSDSGEQQKNDQNQSEMKMQDNKETTEEKTENNNVESKTTVDWQKPQENKSETEVQNNGMDKTVKKEVSKDGVFGNTHKEVEKTVSR